MNAGFQYYAFFKVILVYYNFQFIEIWHKILKYVFFITKLKNCSLLESKVQKEIVWLVLEGEIDSRKFLNMRGEGSSFTIATFSIYLVLLQKNVSVNVLLLTE